MYLSDLLNKSEKDLKSISKADIIKCLLSSKWQYTNLESQVKDLENKLKVAEAPYDQAKLLLCGAANIKIEPTSEYDSTPNLKEIDLCYLIGALLGKQAELLAK